MSDLGRCPLPLLGGLCHIGLDEQMVDGYKRMNNTTCRPRFTGKIGTGKRPQATNRIGKREGVYLDVLTLSMGEFSWKVGL